MAIVKCFECGNEISDKATTCPHCGAPLNLSIQQNEEVEDCTLIIQREQSQNMQFRKISIFCDGEMLDTLGDSQIGEYYAPVGNHVIELFAGKKSIGTTQFYIDGSSDIQIKFYITSNGTVAFETTGYTKPGRKPSYVIPVPSESIADVKKKEKHETIDGLLGVVIIVIVILALYVLFHSELIIRFTITPG